MGEHQQRSVRLSWQSGGDRLQRLKRRYLLLPCAANTKGYRYDWIAAKMRYRMPARAWRHVKRLCRQITRLARKMKAWEHRYYGCDECAMGSGVHWSGCDCRCRVCCGSRQHFRALAAASQ